MIIDTNTFNKTEYTDFSDWYMSLNPEEFTPHVIEYPSTPPNEFEGPESNFTDWDWKRPRKLKLVSIMSYDYPNNEDYGKARKFIHESVPDNCECMHACYYPPGGHIGWHTNSNFVGYNILLTYSETGDSFFEYVNNNEVIRVNDPIGWSYKIIKWGVNEEKVWHRAEANCNRITITYYSENLVNIENFRDTLL